MCNISYLNPLWNTCKCACLEPPRPCLVGRSQAQSCGWLHNKCRGRKLILRHTGPRAKGDRLIACCLAGLLTSCLVGFQDSTASSQLQERVWRLSNAAGCHHKQFFIGQQRKRNERQSGKFNCHSRALCHQVVSAR